MVHLAATLSFLVVMTGVAALIAMMIAERLPAIVAALTGSSTTFAPARVRRVARVRSAPRAIVQQSMRRAA